MSAQVQWRVLGTGAAGLSRSTRATAAFDQTRRPTMHERSGQTLDNETSKTFQEKVGLVLPILQLSDNPRIA
jgi:hypothetical protein